MPYIVTNSDGSLTVTVADNTVDTATYSLALVGRNVSNYGQFFAQNTIRHLENFASTVAPGPSVRLVGQLWYDKREQLLRVWDGSAWRRATNIGVGPQANRPATQLGGGEGFYNLTNNKLEIYNGTSWREASYPGTITTEFANNQSQNLSQFLGSRTRTLFLRDTSGLIHPVLVASYVNSPDASTPTLLPGETEVESGSGQLETIIALFSQTEFDIDSTDAFFTELTATGGIAAPRGSEQTQIIRPLGKILRGINIRADAETASVTVTDNILVANANVTGRLLATEVGSSAQRVSDAFIDNADINTLDVDSLTVDGNISAQNSKLEIGNIHAGGSISANGNISSAGEISASSLSATSATFSALVVNSDTTLNGNITVNGVNTQTIGSETEVIEDYYGENITTANITVLNTAVYTSTGLAIQVPTGSAEINDLSVTGNLTISEGIEFGDSDIITTGNIQGTNLTLNGAISGATTGSFSTSVTAPQFNGNISGVTGSFTGTVFGAAGEFTGNVSAQFFVGTATQARYADLAEIYATDADYEPGTVVKIGGSAEITATQHYADDEVFGVISTDPAYLMNSSAQGLPVALQGRVPVRVIGKVHKGQRLVSAMVPGMACALIDETAYDPRTVIGRALVDKDTEDAGVIEAVIGVK